MPTRLCDRKKTFTHSGPEEPREELIVSYCKLTIRAAAPSPVSLPLLPPLLYSLSMRGELVSAPLKTAHSCAGSAPVLSVPNQPAKRIQPEPRRQDRGALLLVLPSFFFSFFFIIDMPLQPASRPDEMISSFSQRIAAWLQLFFPCTLCCTLPPSTLFIIIVFFCYNQKQTVKHQNMSKK